MTLISVTTSVRAKFVHSEWNKSGNVAMPVCPGLGSQLTQS